MKHLAIYMFANQVELLRRVDGIVELHDIVVTLAKQGVVAGSLCVAEGAEQLNLPRHTLLHLSIHTYLILVVYFDGHLETSFLVSGAANLSVVSLAQISSHLVLVHRRVVYCVLEHCQCAALAARPAH